MVVSRLRLASRSSRTLPWLALSQARQYSSQNIQHRLQQAHRALSEQDLTKAKTLFVELSTEKSASIDIYYNLGVVEWLSKNPSAALSSWQKALDIESDDKQIKSDCHTNLANYYLLYKQDLHTAIGHLRSASELSPTDGEIRYNYGLALEKDDQIELALENYLRAEELGIQKNINALITNAGAKLLKRNSELPPTKEELQAVENNVESSGTQVDYGPSGNGR